MEYKGVAAKYQWECSKGHTWDATANSIQQGQWCPTCADTAHDLAWLHGLVATKDGICHATEYKGMLVKYPWQCSKGHTWEAVAYSIQRGSWCPHCKLKTSKAECTIYKYVKDLFPDTIQSKRGLLFSKGLELDIYVPSLKKAIEFDGIYWHKSDQANESGTPERDIRKDRECIKVGITLLRVDELDFKVNPEAVYSKIKEFLGAEI
jgi:very-short-patch-repair endonuclease